MKSLGIYVHIPYCAKKCAYCDFYSVPSCETSRAYCRALVKQIESYGKKSAEYIVDTIYIGGGTPSYIDAEDISDIVGAIRRTFKVDKNAEISIEANPGTLDGGKLVCDGSTLKLYKLDTPEPEFTKINTEPFATPKVTEINVETDGKNPQHNGVLIAFADAILHGGKLVADGREGINGLTISNAMHLSSWLGKEVTIPFDAELYKSELMKRVATSRHKENVKEVVADTSSSYNSGK